MAVLCAAALALVRDHARGDSATIDEPLHIFGGAEYVMLGTYFTNPEHPPLTKDLAGLALRTASPTPPRIAIASPGPPPEPFMEFFHRNRVPYAEILARAREPFRWLLALLVIAVYLIARAAWGTGAAVLSAGLVALEPNLIAHAGIVHTDVAATLMMAVTIALTVAAIGATAPRWLLVGVALGIAISAKFTALLLVPLILAAPLLLLLQDSWTRKQLGEQFAGAIAACIVAALVIVSVYAVNERSMHPDDAALSAGVFLGTRGVDPATMARYERITRAAPPVGLFLAGIKGVSHLSAQERDWNFLNGRISRKGFPHYFFVAFLLKSTPAVLLVTLAILAGGRLLRTKWAIGLLVPVVVLFAASIPSSFNIGVRHILPVYPLLVIAGAGVLARRLPRRVYAGVAAALIAASAFSLWSSHPHELGYFNALARGDGGRLLSDSNIDWGQDLGRLSAFLRARGWEKDTTVLVFGTIINAPEIAGFPQLVHDNPLPGRYAVSSSMEYLGPYFARRHEGDVAANRQVRLLDALHTRGRKVARVGASITIWELP